VSKLDIGPSDHLDGLYNVIGMLLEPLLKLWSDGQHGRGAVGITGVDPHGIHIFDETDRNHLILGIPHHFKFQFFPPLDRFFDEDLADETRRDAAGGNDTQFLHIIHMASAGSAHGVRRPDHDGVAQLGRNLFGLFHAEGRLAVGHVDAELVHGLLENDPILAPFNGIDIDADDADPIFFQDAFSRQLGREIQPRLTSQVWEQGIGALL